MATRRGRTPTLADIRPPTRRPGGARLGRLPGFIPGVRPKGYRPDRVPIDFSKIPRLARQALEAYFASEDVDYLQQLEESTQRQRDQILGKEDVLSPNTPLEFETDRAESRARWKAAINGEGPLPADGKSATVYGPKLYVPEPDPPEKQKQLQGLISDQVRTGKVFSYMDPGQNIVNAQDVGVSLAGEFERTLLALLPQVTKWDFSTGTGRPVFDPDDVIKTVARAMVEKYPGINPQSGQHRQTMDSAFWNAAIPVAENWRIQVQSRLNQTHRAAVTNEVVLPVLNSLADSALDPDANHRPAAIELDDTRERAFQGWYAEQAKKTGISPDPDDPALNYEFRAAFLAGKGPTRKRGKWVWPDEFERATPSVDKDTGLTPDGKTPHQVATTEALAAWKERHRITFPGNIDDVFTSWAAGYIRQVAARTDINELEKLRRIEEFTEIVEDVPMGGAQEPFQGTPRGREFSALAGELTTRIEGNGGAGASDRVFLQELTEALAPAIEEVQQELTDPNRTNDAAALILFREKAQPLLDQLIQNHPEWGQEEKVRARAAFRQIMDQQGRLIGVPDFLTAARDSVLALAALGETEEARELAGQMLRSGTITFAHYNDIQKSLADADDVREFLTPDTAIGQARNRGAALLQELSKLNVPALRLSEVSERFLTKQRSIMAQHREAIQAARAEGKDPRAAGEAFMAQNGEALFTDAEAEIREVFKQQEEQRNAFTQMTLSRKRFSESEQDAVRQWFSPREAARILERNHEATSVPNIRHRRQEAINRGREQIQNSLLTSLPFVQKIKEEDPLADRMANVVAGELQVLYSEKVDQAIMRLRDGGFTDEEFGEAMAKVAEEVEQEVRDAFGRLEAGDKTINDIILRQRTTTDWRRTVQAGDQEGEKQVLRSYLSDLHPALQTAMQEVQDDVVEWMRSRRRHRGQKIVAGRNLWLDHNMPEASRDIDVALAGLQLTAADKREANYQKSGLLFGLRHTDVLSKTDVPGKFEKGISDYAPFSIPFFRSRDDLSRFEKDRDYAYRFLEHVGFTGLDTSVALRQNPTVHAWLEIQLDLMAIHGKD